MSTRRSGVQSWIEQFLRADPPRSKSLMVTLLGDSIAPRAGALWLSELIQLLRAFHMNERLVRTSTFRLAEEGWLAPHRQGRRSRYALTKSGLERIDNAERRIYEPAQQRWKGLWTVVILNRNGNEAGVRAELRRELDWAGFGRLAPNVVLHPCADPGALAASLQRLGLGDCIVVLEARDLRGITALPSRALVRECWNLEELARLYVSFSEEFQPLLGLTEEGMEPQAAFAAQTLLIHAFRRVVLRDPRLPAELLPERWPGQTAYELCRELYLRFCAQTGNYLAGHLEDGGAKITSRRYYQRFGGLAQECSVTTNSP